ncbi:MAG: glutathione synthase [Pseudomonadales bacterium]
MTPKLAFLMDPLETINIKKDSTHAMMQAAETRGWEVSCLTQADIYTTDGKVWLDHSRVKLSSGKDKWYEIVNQETHPAEYFNAIFLRKDPPFNMEYIYTTYLLELAEQQGVPVLNRPGSVRDCNEKLFALQFPQVCPPHLVSRSPDKLHDFYEAQKDVIFKPLDGMGGASIFHAGPGEHNLSVIIETLTDKGQQQVMAQRYIPEITAGDTRILLIDGEALPYGLARIPKAGETRGNLAAGATPTGRELNDRDRFICDQIAPQLRQRGLYFVGIDVIGDYLTEINVTCPTGIKELDAAFNVNIASDYMDFVEGMFGKANA